MKSAGSAAPSVTFRGALEAIEQLITALAGNLTATLAVAEMLLLATSVVARYVFVRPLEWSDELASMMFVWLGMLGAVVALGRGQHMRLTIIVNRIRPARRAWLEMLSGAVTIGSLLALLLPAAQFTIDQWDVITPGLGVPDGLRILGILVGIALMALLSITRLLRTHSVPQALATLGLVCLALLSGWALQDTTEWIGNINLVIFFILIVGGCLLVGTPIALCFGAATVAYLIFATSTPMIVVINRLDAGMSSLTLLAIPLFIFLGFLMELMGLAQALVGLLSALLGRFRGGLSYALLGAMYLVSGISGSKGADMAAVAPCLLPEMRRNGTAGGELVAQLGAASAMSETIPPSLVLITIGSVCSVSIADLFAGGMVPAAVGALALGAVVYWRVRRGKIATQTAAPGRALMRTAIIALPALVLPFLIRAAVVKGVATATEVSTVGILYSFVVGALVYRKLDPSQMWPALVKTASLSGAIMLIIGTATAMGWALTQSGFSHKLVQIMIAVPGGKAGFLAVSIVTFAVLGSLLEGIPAMVLFGPLLFPPARALGINEVHYAMTVVLAMGLGLFAPPFGLGFYTACAIGQVSPDEALRQIWPYLGALLVVVVMVAAIPWLSIGFL